MTKIYLVEDIDGSKYAYKTLSKAQEFILGQYTKWLKNEAEKGHEIPVTNIAEDLESLYEYWTIEDFYWILEVSVRE